MTPAVTGTAGSNGFHTTTPSVVWAVSDAESPVLDKSCPAGSVTSETTSTGVTFTCTASSGGGTSTRR